MKIKGLGLTAALVLSSFIPSNAEDSETDYKKLVGTVYEYVRENGYGKAVRDADFDKKKPGETEFHYVMRIGHNFDYEDTVKIAGEGAKTEFVKYGLSAVRVYANETEDGERSLMMNPYHLFLLDLTGRLDYDRILTDRDGNGIEDSGITKINQTYQKLLGRVVKKIGRERILEERKADRKDRKETPILVTRNYGPRRN